MQQDILRGVRWLCSLEKGKGNDYLKMAMKFMFLRNLDLVLSLIGAGDLSIPACIPHTFTNIVVV